MFKLQHMVANKFAIFLHLSLDSNLGLWEVSKKVWHLVVGPLEVSEKFSVVVWSSDNTVSKVQVLRRRTLNLWLWTWTWTFAWQFSKLFLLDWWRGHILDNRRIYLWISWNSHKIQHQWLGQRPQWHEYCQELAWVYTVHQQPGSKSNIFRKIVSYQLPTLDKYGLWWRLSNMWIQHFWRGHLDCEYGNNTITQGPTCGYIFSNG